jgi:hypothetical protein
MTNMDNPGDEVNFIENISLPVIAGFALALMAIKPPHNRDNLNISRAQVSLTDIPATISSILNLDDKFDGRSVFEVDPNEVRERRFYYHDWRKESWQQSYFPRLDEFVVKGSVFDKNSWRLGSTYYTPDQSK